MLDDGTLLIAMSDQQSLLRHWMTRSSARFPCRGNPRQTRFHDGHYFVAHLAGNWPADRQPRIHLGAGR